MPARLVPAHGQTPPDAAVPWWRVGVMWLVVGGLGVVVVASFALLATALRQADAVVPHTSVRSVENGTPSAPAMQARNHAATPPPARQPAAAAP